MSFLFWTLFLVELEQMPQNSALFLFENKRKEEKRRQLGQQPHK